MDDLKQPWYRYRPTRVRDGRGGFAESLGEPITIFGVMRVHDTGEVIIVEGDADVDVMDIIQLREN